MVTPESLVLRPTGRLNHDEAARLANLAAASKARTVIIDMTRVTEATTPGLARLVLARRDLLQSKRDIRIAGLSGQPARLLEVHRLQEVLPPIHELPAERPVHADAAVTKSRRAKAADAVPSCLTGLEQICYA